MTKIAIAISTFNRKSTFFRCCHNIWLNTDEEIKVFTVDAGSDTNYALADHKFKERATISEVKNKCLQLCYESGSDHIFLFDDDSWPIKQDWHLPYINSGIHHLCYTFLPHYMTYNETIKFHHLGNGCMMYFTRECIDRVGGFDTKYNNKYEHCDLSRRIFNAGLTHNAYMDVVGSDKLIYCLDQNREIQRSFTHREMQDNLKAGYEYFRSQENSSRYIEFKT